MASNNSQLESGNDALNDYQCSLCEDEGQHVEATKFCKECCVYMCESCVETKHDKFPLNKRHQMLGQQQFSAVKDASLQSFPTKRCPKHPGELINIFCGDHNVVCCLVCKALEHSTCVKSQHLCDAAKGIRSTKQYQSVNKEIKAFISDIQKVFDDRTTDTTRIEDDRNKIKNKITDFRTRKDKYFKDLEKESLKELQEKGNMSLGDIEQDIRYLDITKGKAADISQQLESYKGNNDCELFVLTKEAERLLSDAKEKVGTISTSVNKSHLFYELDPKIEEYLRNIEMLGSFSDAPVSIYRQPKVPTKLSTDIPSKIEISMSNAYGAQVHVCPPFAMCALPDGNILLTSSVNTLQVGRFDKLNTVFQYVQLPGNVISVCVVDDNQAAVLYEQEADMMKDAYTVSEVLKTSFVGFLSLKKPLILNRVFSIDYCALGMACANGKLYVCCKDVNHNVRYKGDYSPSRIAVYGTDGQLHKYIPQGQQRFPFEIKNISVSDDGLHVFVRNTNIQTITMLDMSGNVLESFSNVAGPFCTDAEGHLVTIHNTGTIVQMSTKHKDTKEILSVTEGIRNPRVICFDKTCSELLVATYEGKQANSCITYTLHRFQLEQTAP